MSASLLSQIEWHDLPVESLTFSATGVDLVVTPYNETTSAYGRFRLSLSDAAAVELDLQGVLAPSDWSALEIASFSYQTDPDQRLSGELGLLPGSVGYWRIRVDDALVDLAQLDAPR